MKFRLPNGQIITRHTTAPVCGTGIKAVEFTARDFRTFMQLPDGKLRDYLNHIHCRFVP